MIKKKYLLLFAIIISCKAKQQSSKVEKPNVVFILADDLGYSDISCMGSSFYETPNIDYIASQGMVFTNGYAGSQVCSEKRSLYWHYPHYGNQGGRPVSIMREGSWKLIHYWEDRHNELYNLSDDIHEDLDLSLLQARRTKEMSEALLGWLNNVGARHPSEDLLYDEKKEQVAIKKKKLEMFKFHENLRKNMLRKNWKPNSTWWGSKPTTD